MSPTKPANDWVLGQKGTAQLIHLALALLHFSYFVHKMQFLRSTERTLLAKYVRPRAGGSSSLHERRSSNQPLSGGSRGGGEPPRNVRVILNLYSFCSDNMFLPGLAKTCLVQKKVLSTDPPKNQSRETARYFIFCACCVSKNVGEHPCPQGFFMILACSHFWKL